VNNLHIITLYKLHNNWVPSRAYRARCVERVELVVSSASSRAVRQARHSQNAWARHVERVESRRNETWRAKWNLGLIGQHRRINRRHPDTLVITSTERIESVTMAINWSVDVLLYRSWVYRMSISVMAS